MNRVLKKFLDSETLSEIIEKEFDYKFKEESSIEEFQHEYKKFMNIYSNYIFQKDALINYRTGELIKLPQKELDQIFKLYRFAYNQELIEKYIIGEFIMLYYNTINNQQYKLTSSTKELVKEYKEIESNYKLKESMYVELQTITYEFYKMLVNFIIENDEFLYDEIIARIRTNIKKSEDFNKLLSKLITKESNIPKLIEYDTKLEEHFKQYNDYIKKEIKNSNVYKYPLDMLLILEKENKLENSVLNIIINDVIDKVNELHQKVYEDKIDLLRDTSLIDNLLKQINKILYKIKSLNNTQKTRLKECRNNIMTIKRYMLSDQEKIDNSLQCFTHKTKIPSCKITKIVNDICENIGVLYVRSKVDFESELKEVIKNYTKYPFNYIVDHITFDSKHQTYYKFDEKKVQSYFKDYYNRLGEKIVKENIMKINNIQKNDYYYLLLKELRTNFELRQKLLIDFLKSKEKFEEIIYRLKSEVELNDKNDYIVVAHNVMEIEIRIVELLKLKKIEVQTEPIYNLIELAKSYENNKEAFNGLMYIYYILYEESGLKIRNNIAHGNLISENLDMEIITTFSATILLQWLLTNEQ